MRPFDPSEDGREIEMSLRRGNRVWDAFTAALAVLSLAAVLGLIWLLVFAG